MLVHKNNISNENMITEQNNQNKEQSYERYITDIMIKRKPLMPICVT